MDFIFALAEKHQPYFHRKRESFINVPLYSRFYHVTHEQYPSYAWIIADQVKKYFGEKKDLRMVELFGGKGFVAFELKEYFPEATMFSVDIADYFEKLPGINYLNVDLITGKFPETYDVLFTGVQATSHNCFTQIGDWLRHFMLCKNALNKDGLLFVSFANAPRFTENCVYHGYEIIEGVSPDMQGKFTHHFYAHDYSKTRATIDYNSLAIVSDSAVLGKGDETAFLYANDYTCNLWEPSIVIKLANTAGLKFRQELSPTDEYLCFSR